MKFRNYINEDMNRNNLASANSYYKVIKPFDVQIQTGSEPSNAYYGSARIHKPVWKAVKAKKGDEIHNLFGGLFFVTGNKTYNMAVGKEPPRWAAFERNTGRYDKFPLNNLEEIEVGRKVKYAI